MLSATAPGSRTQRSGKAARIIARTLALLLFGGVLYTVILYIVIARQARLDETRPADVIVVFGAAEYAGHPSPIYRARLDHAATLFQRGLAPIIITTGSSGGDPNFSEGEVGRNYLIAHGIPKDQIIAETQGYDTLESAARLAAIMNKNGMKDCLAVSDGYHMFRIKQMLRSLRVTAFASPRPDPHSERLETLKEVFKYTAWRLHFEWIE